MFIPMYNSRWSPVWDEPNEGGGTPAPSAISGAEENLPASSAISGAEGDTPSEAPKTPTESAPEETPTITLEGLKFPEGVEPSEELTTPFLEIINDNALSRAELAQKIVDLQLETTQRSVAAADEAAQTQWNDLQSQWLGELRADPEIGGAELDRTLATVKQGLLTAGATSETFAALDMTGAGSNPEIVRIMYALTKNLKEGSLVSGEPAAGKLTQAERMFGGHTE